MAKRPTKERARPAPLRLRVLFHPQRGGVLSSDPISPGCLRYRGGQDSAWREITEVAGVVAPDGTARPAPNARLPHGFLWGEPERQCYGLGGPELVLGPLEKTCRDCGVAFVFTAAEQKHLYETLRLYIDVTSVRCVSCRRARRELERKRRAYADALHAAEASPSAGTHLAVAKAALELRSAGGRAPLDKAIAHCRRARRFGASASADRLEQALARLRTPR